MVKKIMAMIIAITLAFSSSYFQGAVIVKADAVTADEWKSTAIISPEQNQLKGAGYIDVKWSNALENVSNYKVYIDGKLKKTAAPSGSVMSCEFYTTSVSKHGTYVVATLKDGTKVQTSVRVFFVTKKGICVNSNDMGVAVDPASMNVGWYYNWGYKSFQDNNFKNTKFNGLDYVPMIWGNNTLKAVAFSYGKSQGYKYMLGYNEPDLQWESNISPSSTAELWGAFRNSGFRLGSPATATFPSWSKNWWTPFWNLVKSNNQFSFIAIHSYQGNYNGATTAQLYLQAVDECYETYHKPIWITEFALAGDRSFDMSNATDRTNAENFMKIVLKGLNQRSYVERFSWFSFEPSGISNKASASGMFSYSTGALTNLGKIYAQIGNPAGYSSKTYGVSSNTSVNVSPAACAAVMPTTLYNATGKKKSFKYEIKEVSKAPGYQLQYSLNKKFSKAKKKYKTKTKNVKKLKGTITKLKKKTKYYVRVRGYKVLNGKKLYCKWSNKIKIKTK